MKPYMTRKNIGGQNLPASIAKIREMLHDGKSDLEEIKKVVDELYQEEILRNESPPETEASPVDYEEKARLFETLTRNIPDAIVFVFDKDYNIVMFFGKEMEQYGYSTNHFSGRKLTEIWDDATVSVVKPLFDNALRGRKARREIVFSEDHYMINAIPVRNNRGEVYAGMSVMTNISEEKNRELQLQHAKRDAEAANQTKSEFMANMSHEIRTPLNSIMGFTEQLGKTQLDDDQRRFKDLIEESSEHLLTIVNEILILLRIGAGSVSIEEVPFHVRNLFNEVNNTFRIRSQKKGIKLDVRVAKEVPEVLVGDPVRLKQILINLLSNSLKFTQFGYVRCTSKAVEIASDRIEMRISVKDSGIGIEKEELDIIFNPFQQADTSVTRKFGGSGLGLTIVKKLVELQNGRIAVSSKKGEGTEFRISIPYGIGEKEDLPEEERIYTTDKELLVDKRILLVDDDETNQLLASTIMRYWNLAFDVAGDGEEALKYLAKAKYDVVLMDIHMPGISGIEVARKIREGQGLIPMQGTRIIAVTANAIKSDIIEYAEAGMDNFLIKPYREDILFNKICNALKIKTYHEPGNLNTEGRTGLKNEESYSKRYDLNELINLSKGDIHFYNNTLRSFVKTTEKTLSNIGEYLEHEQWQDLGEQAHKIISSARFLGLSDIANICVQIEDNTLRNNNYETVPVLVKNLIKKMNVVLSQLKNEYISKN
jgi:PAS domain S-box-containing protein